MRRTAAAAFMALAAAGTSACGNDSREPAADAPCAVRLSPDAALRTLLRSYASDAELGVSFDCAAMLVAPNVLLTAARCVSKHVLDPFQCDPQQGWRLIEEGGAQGRLGELFSADAVSIAVPDYTGRLRMSPVRVARLLAFGARTSCMDDLAAIILEGELALEPVPLRLQPAPSAEAELALGLYSRDLRERVLQPVQVAESASALGTVAAPPRALRLSGAACNTGSGDPVIAPATGALVALSFQTLLSGGSCDGGADVIALQLSEYADFLRDVAAQAGAELRVEAAPSAPEGDAHCPASPAQ